MTRTSRLRASMHLILEALIRYIVNSFIESLIHWNSNKWCFNSVTVALI
jgi:hypothetical protein